MQNLMEKVEEMRSQRSMLTSQLRDSICKDDITQLLVTNQNENVDTLFQEELKKHQDIVGIMTFSKMCTFLLFQQTFPYCLYAFGFSG